MCSGVDGTGVLAACCSWRSHVNSSSFDSAAGDGTRRSSSAAACSKVAGMSSSLRFCAAAAAASPPFVSQSKEEAFRLFCFGLTVLNCPGVAAAGEAEAGPPNKRLRRCHIAYVLK